MKMISRKYIYIYILVLTIFVSFPLFNSSIFNGHDFGFHLTRIQGIRDAIVSRTSLNIYPYANFSFGYGSPMFYCDIFLYLPAILYLLGLPIVVSYKVYLFLFILIGNILALVMFEYINRDSEHKDVSVFIGMLFYALADARLFYYYIQSGAGSCAAYSIMPILFLAIYKLCVEGDSKCWLLLGLSFSLILLSHVLSFGLAVLFFGIICICNLKKLISNPKLIVCISLAAIFAIGLTSFFLFPFLEQNLSQKFWMSFTIPAEGAWMIKSSLIPLKELFQDYIIDYPCGDLRKAWVYFGTLHAVLPFVLAVIICVKRKKIDRFNICLLVILAVGLLLNSDILPLEKVTILYSLQIMNRINIILTMISAIVVSALIGRLNNKSLERIIILASAVYLVINVGYGVFKVNSNAHDALSNDTPYSEIYALGEPMLKDTHHFNLEELGHGEYLPLTDSYPYSEASTNIVFADESVYLWDFDRVGTTIRFDSDYDYSDYVYMPLSWYKGYYYQELDENGKVLFESECISNEYNKRVGFKIDSGYHRYKVYYKGTLVQKLSMCVSLMTIVSTAYLTIRKYRKHGLPG